MLPDTPGRDGCGPQYLSSGMRVFSNRRRFTRGMQCARCNVVLQGAGGEDGFKRIGDYLPFDSKLMMRQVDRANHVAQGNDFSELNVAEIAEGGERLDYFVRETYSFFLRELPPFPTLLTKYLEDFLERLLQFYACALESRLLSLREDGRYDDLVIAFLLVMQDIDALVQMLQLLEPIPAYTTYLCGKLAIAEKVLYRHACNLSVQLPRTHFMDGLQAGMSSVYNELNRRIGENEEVEPLLSAIGTSIDDIEQEEGEGADLAVTLELVEKAEIQMKELCNYADRSLSDGPKRSVREQQVRISLIRDLLATYKNGVSESWRYGSFAPVELQAAGDLSAPDLFNLLVLAADVACVTVARTQYDDDDDANRSVFRALDSVAKMTKAVTEKDALGNASEVQYYSSRLDAVLTFIRDRINSDLVSTQPHVKRMMYFAFLQLAKVRRELPAEWGVDITVAWQFSTMWRHAMVAVVAQLVGVHLGRLERSVEDKFVRSWLKDGINDLNLLNRSSLANILSIFVTQLNMKGKKDVAVQACTDVVEFFDQLVMTQFNRTDPVHENLPLLKTYRDALRDRQDSQLVRNAHGVVGSLIQTIQEYIRTRPGRLREEDQVLLMTGVLLLEHCQHCLVLVDTGKLTFLRELIDVQSPQYKNRAARLDVWQRDQLPMLREPEPDVGFADEPLSKLVWNRWLNNVRPGLMDAIDNGGRGAPA